MGDITYEGLPDRVFESRKSFVLTNKDLPRKANTTFVPSTQELLKELSKTEKACIFAIGGADTITRLMQENLIDSFILSRIPGTYQGDVFLPPHILKEITSWPTDKVDNRQNFSIHYHHKPA